MARPFNSELVLEERISESTLRGYHVGFEQNIFRLQPLVDIIRNVIPEFALGYYNGQNVPLTDLVERLKEAATTVYTTDKYQKRGEFGELILHLLLRDFCGTVPLISKMYFKDALNVNIHGFDGVHVTTDAQSKKLWLGESKLYKDGQDGVKELANDVKNHLNADYLRSEFDLICRKLPHDTPDIEYWRILMHKHQRLETIFSGICMPLVCTYSSSLFTNHSATTDQYLHDFITECRALKDTLDGKVITTNVDLILLLLPVPDKDELNTALDDRLKHMQRI